MSSRTGGGGPIRRRSGRHAAKQSGATTSSAADVHSPLHEMHHAIERFTTNFDHIQKLLDKGGSFCRGDGVNCFILAAWKRNAASADSSNRCWTLLMKMLQIDSRGILARDADGLTLLNYVCKDLNLVKQLIERGADLKNVDKTGKSLVQSLFNYEVFESSSNRYGGEHTTSTFVKLWDMLLEHKEIQNQVTKGAFFNELVLQIKNKCSLARKMFFNFIKKGLMSVEEMTAKLHMHPLFLIIQLECKWSLQLLIYIWSDDPDKNKNVAALGENLNIVDKNGKSLLECLFNYHVLKKYDHFQEVALELWKLLITRSEIQSQASKKGYFRSIAPLAKDSYLVKDIFVNIFQLGVWSIEKLTSECQVHPLFFVLKLAFGKPSGFLQVLKSYPDFLKHKAILVTKNIANPKRNYPPEWLKVKSVLHIPHVVTFDVLGYIFFTLELYCFWSFESKANKDILKCMRTLLKNDFVPTKAAGVVHPIHALLYNICMNSQKIIYAGESTIRGPLYVQKNLPNILVKIITAFEDFPVPHKLVQDPETGSLMLDVNLLISSMICPAIVSEPKANNALFELIMAVMQLSPCHPLQNFTTFFKYSSCYFIENYHLSNEIFLETFCKILRLTLEASGRHKFQGVDQPTINCVNSFCESVEAASSHYQQEFKEISLHKRAAVKAESEVSSLQWLSILQIRKTLFLQRSSTTFTLPSLIRGLVADKRLPKGLEADVLVYNPYNTTNF